MFQPHLFLMLGLFYIKIKQMWSLTDLRSASWELIGFSWRRQWLFGNSKKGMDFQQDFLFSHWVTHYYFRSHSLTSRVFLNLMSITPSLEVLLKNMFILCETNTSKISEIPLVYNLNKDIYGLEQAPWACLNDSTQTLILFLANVILFGSLILISPL